MMNCGQSNIIVLIIYKEKNNNNGLDYLNYYGDNIDNTLYINNSQTTTTYEMKTSM